jgi:hypothetical protein
LIGSNQRTEADVIRVLVAEEHRTVDIRTDATCAPDVLNDIVNRAVTLMAAPMAPAEADV